MKRVFNFSPGPSMLPNVVMQKVQQDLLDWEGSGMSVMEISHRSDEFLALAHLAEENLIKLLNIPNDYAVLFLHGGASLQYSAIPLNLGKNNKADYIITGHWGQKSEREARKFTKTQIAVDTMAELRLPTQQELNLDPKADYVHFAHNETILGLEFNYVPNTQAVPLVADMSSNILSRPIDISKYSVIYAGAQKNISISGLGLVIAHRALIGKQKPNTPGLLSWKEMLDNECMLNTPSTFSWYMAGEVFKWLIAQGGLANMQKINEQKARLIYDFIDSNDFYHNPIEVNSRSVMNVAFTLADESLNNKFLEQAKEQGLTNLKGHALFGGMRASIYNAMPIEGVQALVNFMKSFAKKV